MCKVELRHLTEIREAADKALSDDIRVTQSAQAVRAVRGARADIAYVEELMNILDGLDHEQRDRALDALWHTLQGAYVIGAYCSTMPGTEKRFQVSNALHMRLKRAVAPQKRKRDALIEAAIAAVPWNGKRRPINKMTELANSRLKKAGLKPTSKSDIKRRTSSGPLIHRKKRSL
jgi:hypothetical protein